MPSTKCHKCGKPIEYEKGSRKIICSCGFKIFLIECPECHERILPARILKTYESFKCTKCEYVFVIKPTKHIWYNIKKQGTKMLEMAKRHDQNIKETAKKMVK